MDQLIQFENRTVDLKEKVALSCYLGKIFYFYNGRNAWNWTWSSKYPGKFAFHPTYQQAKDAVEKRRVQGSTWDMREMPAVVVAGEKDLLIVTEINTETPLKDFITIDFSSNTLESIGLLFEPKKENSVMRFITSSGTIGPALLPFKGYKAYSQGTPKRYYLGWSSKKEERDFDSALELIKQINLHLQNT